MMPAMSTFAVVAHAQTPTNTRLGAVLRPAQAVSRLRSGDIALGRLDVLPSLDGIEPGLWALDLLAQRGVIVLNTRSSLTIAHDKLATAGALGRAGLPHPRTTHVAPWRPEPEIEPPFVLKPRFGSWGRDVIRCDSWDDYERARAITRTRVWFNAAGAVAQELVPPMGFDLRLVVASGRIVGAIHRYAAAGEWRTNVAFGGRRVPTVPSARAAELAIQAAAAVGGDLVGVDLLPHGDDWVVLEVNGAVDFTGAYSFDDEVFAAVRAALVPNPVSVGAPGSPVYSYA